MKSGDLVEFRSTGLLGSIVRKFTGEDVNHSAIVFRIDDYKFIKDRVFLIDARSMGLEITAFSERLLGYEGEVYWYKLKADDTQRDMLISYAISLATKKREDKLYDYAGLFENMFHRVGVDMSKVFCSEVYHVCLMVAGIVPAVDQCCRPGEFTRLGVHEPRKLIYEL